jgi:hypothetical protein
MKNLFKDAMYLFNMEIDKLSVFTSENNSAYQLKVMPAFDYTVNDLLSLSDIPSGVKLDLYLFENNKLIEKDDMSGDFVNSKFFFEYLRWFNDEPKIMIDSLYKSIHLKTIA